MSEQLIHASEVKAMREVNGMGADNWVGNVILEPPKYAGAIILAQGLNETGEQLQGCNAFTHGFLQIQLSA